MSFPPPPPRRRNAPNGAPPAPPPVNREAREARRAEERGSSRKQTLLMVGGGILAVAVIAVVAIAVLSGNDEKKAGPKFKESTFVDLKVGSVGVASTGQYLASPDYFTPELRKEIISDLGAYVDNGIVLPLRKGKANAKADASFDQGALARLGTADRSVVLDEGLPKAVGEVRIDAPPVDLYGLSNRDATMLLVAASIDFKISAETEHGTVKIHRVGELVFALQLSGEWKIAGWTLHVDRSGPGVQTTTTAPPAPTTTTAG